METKSSKQFGVSATSLWDKYRSDLFFRTTCHIIVLQVVLTAVAVTGLWFVMQYLMKETSDALISTFAQMLQGQTVTEDTLNGNLASLRAQQFWPAMVVTSAVVLSFGFVMAYVALTPTRRSLERKRRFVSNIAHELRTPLAIMRTNTDVALLHEDMTPELRNMLERNVVEFERISGIMNNLLSLSNFMQNKYPRFEDVDLSAVARRATDVLTETIDHKDITLTLKSHTSQTVLGNASALEQVVFNLVKNAVAHTQKQGDITIEIEPSADGKYINLSVSDTGCGISREDLFHVFEPFYRARTAPKNDGHGLGLAIVNEIVQMHRGKIRIRSTEGRGTTVIVSIKRNTNGGAVAASEHAPNTEEVTMDFSHRILP